MGRNGIINVRRSNWTFQPPNRLGSVSCYWGWNLIITGPTQKEPPKPRLMTMEEMDSDEDYNPNDAKEQIERAECHTLNSVNPVK